jgi:nucleotide-binding universal stress UspA family protein
MYFYICYKLAHEKKTKFYKILVAVDGSDHSKRAAGYAIDLARSNKAQLMALTVLNIANIGSASAFIASPMHGLAELNQMRKEAQEWLDEVARLATSQKKDNDYIEFKSRIEESMSVAGAIVEFAENENIDLIVVGSRGRSGFTKLLLGSIASRVVTYATCPVLVIK